MELVARLGIETNVLVSPGCGMNGKAGIMVPQCLEAHCRAGNPGVGRFDFPDPDS